MDKWFTTKEKKIQLSRVAKFISAKISFYIHYLTDVHLKLYSVFILKLKETSLESAQEFS
jgi:hypothetical protein